MGLLVKALPPGCGRGQILLSSDVIGPTNGTIAGQRQAIDCMGEPGSLLVTT